MLLTLKHFLTRGYTLFIVSLFIFTFSILKVSAVYYTTDNITNPTCAPGDTGCYVSLLPDQTSKSGSLLFSNGTNPSWTSNSALNWDSVNGRLGVGTSTPVSNLDITTTTGNSAITMKGNSGVFMSMYRYSNNTTRSRYEMYKARGDQVTPLVVQNNDELGSMDFYGYDGTAFQRNAIILVNAANVSGATITPRLSFGLGASSGTNDYYFSLNSTGAVFSAGSSTSITPLGRLHLKGSTVDSTANALYVENSAATNLLTVRNDGNVGIGTTNLFDKFSISGLNQSLSSGRGQLGVYSSDDMGINNGGQIVLGGSDTTGGVPVRSFASIAGRKLNSISGDRTGYLQFSVRADSSGDLTEYMRIISGGNVGIGTTTPSSLLHIKSTSGTDASLIIDTTTADTTGADAYLSLREAGTEKWKIRSVGDDNDSLKIGTASANWIKVVAASGNVGIGSNITSSYRLHVGTAADSGIVARFQNSTGTCDINPTTTALSCSSDRNLKTNISPLGNTLLNTITTLEPVTYTWISDSSNSLQTGFIAQDVEAIFPNLVSTDPTTNLKSLNYIGLIPYAIEGIRELHIKIEHTNTLFNNDESRLQKIKAFFDNLFGLNQLCVDGECLTKEDVRVLIDIARDAQGNQPAEQSEIPQNQNNNNQNTGETSGDAVDGESATNLTQ